MKVLQKLEDLVSTLAQNQEDFHTEQRLVNGKLIRAIHGEKDNKVPGLIDDMAYVKIQVKAHKNFRNKIIWVSIGFGAAITLAETLMHLKELKQLLQ